MKFKLIVFFQRKKPVNSRSMKTFCLTFLVGMGLISHPKAVLANQTLCYTTQEHISYDDTFIAGFDCLMNGDFSKAKFFFQAILESTQTDALSMDAATAWYGLGNVQRQQGNTSEAISHYENSARIIEANLDIEPVNSLLAQQANVYSAIGDMYVDLDQYDSAVDYYNDSEERWRRANRPVRAAYVLVSISWAYNRDTQYQLALSSAERALEIFEVERNLSGQARVLDNIGSILDNLGDYEGALINYEKSLRITEELCNRGGKCNLNSKAVTLNNIGFVLNNLNKHSDAYTRFQEALSICENNSRYCNQELYAKILSNLGESSLYLKNYEQAIEYTNKSITLKEQVNDQLGIVRSYRQLGTIYMELSTYSKSEEYYRRSLEKLYLLGDQEAEMAQVLSEIGQLLINQENPELAIIFLKESINKYEKIRANNDTLTQKLKESYISSVEETYRLLTNLLIEQGRLLEAQRVLELLKVEEIRRFTRATLTSEGVIYDSTEKAVIESYGSLIALGAKINDCYPDCGQILIDRQIDLKQQYDTVVDTFKTIIRQNRAEDDVFYDPEEFDTDARDIIDGQPGTVLIYPIVLEDRLWLLWTAAGDVVGSIEIEDVNRQQLDNKILKFRTLIEKQDAESFKELKLISQQLYKWLVEPLSKELEVSNIEHLVFVQDRSTRYLPMAALYDGKKFLIEKYTVSTVLSAKLTDMADRLRDIRSPRVLALGLTQSIPGYSSLPNVSEELDVVVKVGNNDLVGIYPGKVFVDQDFTFDTMRQNVRHYQILHIATHAEFIPHIDGESYILSGIGESLTTSEISLLDSQFRNLHLGSRS